MSGFVDDGFQMVSHRKAARRKGTEKLCAQQWKMKNQEIEASGLMSDSAVTDEITKLQNCQQILKSSQYYRDVLEVFVDAGVVLSPDAMEPFSASCTESCSAKNSFVVEDLISYGIGNFTSCPTARYQLAFLLLLCRLLNVPGEHCSVYEPHFTAAEKAVITQLGLRLISVNEEGKRRSERRTLYYMPHCGKPLYNNLLWANWHPTYMSRTAILGNSFANMSDSMPSRILSKNFPYIDKILPLTTERPLANSFEQGDVFNDTSLHLFLKAGDTDERDILWSDAIEPQYSDSEHNIEFVRSETGS